MTSEEIDALFEQWNLRREYIIFGNADLLPCLDKIHVRYLIDNNQSKWHTNWRGKEIFSPEQLQQENGRLQVIIANPWSRSQAAMARQLVSMGLSEKKDFISYKFLLTLWGWKYEQKIVSPYVEYMITTRCTLKCKNCVLYIPYFTEPVDLPLTSIKKDIDAYFSQVDRVEIFRLLGGEPFLHKNLKEILRYMETRYIARIGSLELVTNGTVRNFDPEILVICHRSKIKVHISNYTQCVDYRKGLEEFQHLLTENQIAYENALPGKWSWKAINPPQKSNGRGRIALPQLFQDCLTHCRALMQGRLYFCSSQCSADLCKAYTESAPGDYLELTRGKIDFYDFIRFDTGDIAAGYVSFCQNCLGMGEMNQQFVQPGEQN